MISIYKNKIHEIVNLACSTKICNGKDALFICDAPRRLSNLDKTKNLINKLNNNVFICNLTHNNMLKIDLAESEYNAISNNKEAYINTLPLDKLEAYSLLKLIETKQCSQVLEIENMRNLIKYFDEDIKFINTVKSIHNQYAIMLRDKLQLSSCTRNILIEWILK